jgi:hypothetical protein
MGMAAGMAAPPEPKSRKKPTAAIQLRTGRGKTFMSVNMAKLYVG